MGRFKIWFAIGGIALGIYGFKQLKLAGEVKTVPQVITCEALGARGYGDNAHVKVKDFLISQGEVVVESKKGSSDWDKVWVPVVPSTGPYVETLRKLKEGDEVPPPKDFKVILQTEHVKSIPALNNLQGGDFLTGIVINEIDSLGSETKNLLRESYPGIDLDKCWILDHRRSAPGAGLSIAMLAGALLLIGLAVWQFVRGSQASKAQA